MKRARYLLGVLLSLVVLLGFPLSTLGQTWDYYLELTVSNSGASALEDYPVLTSVDIQSLIDAGFLDSNGLETRVMEGSTELPYVVFDDDLVIDVGDLAAYQSKELRFYLGYSSAQTDVDILVGDGGYVTIADDADLELGNDFSLDLNGVALNTDAAAGKDILYKEDSFRLWVSAEDTISAALWTDGSVIPTSTVSGAGWLTPDNSWDNDTGTQAMDTIPHANYGDYLTLGIPSTTVCGFAIYGALTSYVDYIQIDVYDGSWTNVYQGDIPDDTWDNIYLDTFYPGVTQIRTRGHQTTSYSNQYYDVNELWVYVGVQLDEGSLASGEYDILVEHTGTSFQLTIDTGLDDSAAISDSAADNVNDWLFMDNSTVQFISSIEDYSHTVSSTLIAHYDPDTVLNGTTNELTDEQGGDEDGTITWGTNNGNVSASIGALVGGQSVVPAASASGAADTVLPYSRPTGWEASASDLSGLPLYDTFNTAAGNMGWTTQTLYGFLMIGTAIAVGTGVILWTGSILAGGFVVGMILAAGANADVLDVWFVLVFAALYICVTFLTMRSRTI